ncbi:unnamed protein product, partial [Phaeothamnion confervicola]
HPLVYLTVRFGEGEEGAANQEKVVIELYSAVCPETCARFASLCGAGVVAGAGSYRGTRFHRVVRDGWVQGGGGSGGGDAHSGEEAAAPYNGGYSFETFAVRFDRPGMVAFASDGVGGGGGASNSSQFFVSLAPLPFMDFSAVAFGRVVKGLDAFRRMSELETLNECPIVHCQIVDCGAATAAD